MQTYAPRLLIAKYWDVVAQWIRVWLTDWKLLSSNPRALNPQLVKGNVNIFLIFFNETKINYVRPLTILFTSQKPCKSCKTATGHFLVGQEPSWFALYSLYIHISQSPFFPTVVQNRTVWSFLPGLKFYMSPGQ